MTISFVCNGQNNTYSNWFDLNLKGTPKSIKEIELLSLTEYFKPEFSVYLNNSLKWNSLVNQYYFDTLGVISKEFHKSVLDTTGRWTDYSKMKTLQYEDSIVLINYDSDGDEAWRERRFLDKNKFIRCKIIDSFCPDTVIFERDSNNRIIKEYRSFYCIDYGQKINTVYELNDNGDVKFEKAFIHSIVFDCKEPCNNKSMIRYEYIYDAKLNWIIKVTFMNNEVLSVTQREIQY